MITLLVIICCLQMISLVVMAYLNFKTVSDLTAKIMAKSLHEVKTFQEKPVKSNPADLIEKSDEVLAMEYEIENGKRIEELRKDAASIGNEMLAKTW